MKKVINSVPKEEVLLKDVDGDKYYGAIISDWRGMVTRENYDFGAFHLKAIEEFTNGNGWGTTKDGEYNKPSLKLLIQELLDKKHKVYEFDTFLELATWAAEEES